MTKNETLELDIQKNILKHIDNFKSFRFNAGAGAGKTYSLIEALRYVAINKMTNKEHSQKVVCITYTNVAVNEIKDRLGNSDTIYISTIHERLWEIIKRAQPQLLICHQEKIKETIEKNKIKLFKPNKDNFFIKLKEKQQEFINFIEKEKEFYYKNKDYDTKKFRESYQIYMDENRPIFLDKTLSNIGDFKYVSNLILNIQKLEICLDKIEKGEEKYVNYDSKINTDILHRMKFSHDTLLEYGLKLVETYPTLCRIIIDSYPYFFIDEYQDTSPNVVKFINVIHNYAVENKRDWMVGYFGDAAQCIYDDGVGENIIEIHNKLENINKDLNRRSHTQIINIANNIRDDEIIQKPFIETRDKGSVVFFHGDFENKLLVAKEFLDEYKNDLINTNSEEVPKLHCLVLTNELMANFNGFGDVYELYRKSNIYYENLNTQVLSQQLEKLHPTVLHIYYLVKLYQDIQNGIASYYDIFGMLSENVTFAKASLLIHKLRNIKITSLKEWLDLIIKELNNHEIKDILKLVLINRIHYEIDKVNSSNIFKSTLFDDIKTLINKNNENENEAKEKIENFLSLPISSLIKWVNFIDGVETEDIIYHTYHGTKGEEYTNVAIILEHSFGKMNKDKFKKYFSFIQKNDDERKKLLDCPDFKKKHINTKNLLYVACSRAIKNLRILYLDDISEIENGIKQIFGEIKPWTTKTTTD